jgi:hypothetical protein
MARNCKSCALSLTCDSVFGFAADRVARPERDGPVGPDCGLGGGIGGVRAACQTLTCAVPVRIFSPCLRSSSHTRADHPSLLGQTLRLQAFLRRWGKRSGNRICTEAGACFCHLEWLGEWREKILSLAAVIKSIRLPINACRTAHCKWVAREEQA